MTKTNIGYTELDPEELIMDAIKNGRVQADVAKAYVWGLRAVDHVDWHEVNMAIINRWSKAGLERVKKMAWNMLDKGEREARE